MMWGLWLFAAAGFVYFLIMESRLRRIEENTARTVEKLEYLIRAKRIEERRGEYAEKYPNLPEI